MFRNSLSWLLAGSLVFALLCATPAAAGPKAETEAQRTEKVKAGIARLGVGRETRVRVRLQDGKKLAGYIEEAREDFFIIVDLKTKSATVVPYPDVTQVKGHRLSKGAKIAIVSLGIAVGVLAFFLWLENAD
jgi:hypothetical protein